MMPYSILYQIKANPGNNNQPIQKAKVSKRFIKSFGQSPLAAEQYAYDCFSHANLERLEIHDLHGCLKVII